MSSKPLKSNWTGKADKFPQLADIDAQVLLHELRNLKEWGYFSKNKTKLKPKENKHKAINKREEKSQHNQKLNQHPPPQYNCLTSLNEKER